MSNTFTSFDTLPQVEQTTPEGARPQGDKRLSRYDAAQTTSENRKHWNNADSLSADAGQTPDVRQRLRDRSRYETSNNGYAKSLVVERADSCIGTGPRLQLTFPEQFTDPDFQRLVAVPEDAARLVELRWCEWADSIDLLQDLHLADRAETRDGEIFAVEITNDGLPDDGPQLDLTLYEAEQCSTPDRDPLDKLSTDGIRFDRSGNPLEYHFLNDHPGSTLFGAFGDSSSYTKIPAWRVYHWFDRDRPSQRRGIPALTPALPLFAMLRRYTLATLGSAELAAMISGVIEQEFGSPDGGNPPEITEMEHVPFARNALMTLGPGQRAKGFDNNKPGPMYGEFKREILTEAGRGIGASRNISTGSSAEYNYSSGRLDHLPRMQSIRIRRDRIRRVMLDRLFKSWLRESKNIPGYLPVNLPPMRVWSVAWQWDGFPSIDPLKDANANQVLLESGQTTLMRVCAERGEDWEDVLRQLAAEHKMREKLGLPPVAVPAGAASSAPSPGGAEDA